MKDRVCLITGGNAGIGKATATALAAKGYKVVIVCRTKEKAEEAAKDIVAKSGNESVEYLVADLSSQISVRQLAEDLKKRYNQLNVLINNAGAYYSDYGETEDKIERQFAINHLAPFLLTNLLLDTIKNSAPARIVTVSSDAHFQGKINFDDLNNSKKYSGYFKGYAQSKLGNVLFTYELARRLQGTGVTATCLYPGVVSTGIAQKHADFMSALSWGFGRLFMLTPQKGARTSVYLASSAEVEGVTGKYFDKCKEKKSSPISYDIDTAKRLWQESEKLVALG